MKKKCGSELNEEGEGVPGRNLSNQKSTSFVGGGGGGYWGRRKKKKLDRGGGGTSVEEAVFEVSAG